MPELERTILGVARAIAYAIVWIAAAVGVFRLGVAQLWGSGSDLGLVGAVLLAAVAIMALAYVGVVMLRDLDRRL
jgi:hypothetical protein